MKHFLAFATLLPVLFAASACTSEVTDTPDTPESVDSDLAKKNTVAYSGQYERKVSDGLGYVSLDLRKDHTYFAINDFSAVVDCATPGCGFVSESGTWGIATKKGTHTLSLVYSGLATKFAAAKTGKQLALTDTNGRTIVLTKISGQAAPPPPPPPPPPSGPATCSSNADCSAPSVCGPTGICIGDD